MIDVEVKTTEPQTVAFIHMHGDYGQIPDAIKRVYRWAGMHGMRPMGEPSTVYYTVPDATAIEAAEWEVLVPLAGHVRQRPEGRKGLGVREMPPHQVAAAMHKGPYDTVGDTYHELEEWVVQHGYRMAGPPEESYLSDPSDTRPEDYLTEIRFPIASTDA